MKIITRECGGKHSVKIEAPDSYGECLFLFCKNGFQSTGVYMDDTLILLLEQALDDLKLRRRHKG